MSERPTPRTDSAIMEIPSKFGSICVVRVELALDLERELGEALDDLQVLRSNKMSDPLLETTFKHLIRERDEAREAAAKWESSSDAMVRAGAGQARRADENREWALRAERERDEAIADRDILRIDAQREAEHHDRMVGELERVYQERDEAREEAGHWKTEYEIVVDRLRGRKHPRDNGIIADDEIIPKLERERDEARQDAAHWESEYEIVVARLCGVKHKRDNGIIFEHEVIPKLERELNEAKAEIQKLRYDAQREAEHHDRMVGEMERLYDEIQSLSENGKRLP